MKITIPIVRVRGWQDRDVPVGTQTLVGQVFAEVAEYDDDQVASTIKRLKAGRSVSLEFDTGDEDAARAFMQRLAGVGLHSTLYSKSFKYHMYHGGFEFFAGATLWIIGPAVVVVICAEPWLGLVLCARGVGALVAAFVIHIMIKRSNRSAELLEQFDERTRAG